MTTMTIHALDPEIEKRIRMRSRKEHKSLNRTLKELLSESVGMHPSSGKDHGSDFAEFAGIWSERDEQEFNEVATDFEQIHAEDWE